MPVGAGAAPAGSSIAGYGVVDSAPVPGVVPLPDPKTGASQTGRLINPATGDYVFTADGRLQGMATVPQLVLLALENNLPTELQRIQEKGPNFAQYLASIVQDALGDLIAQGLVLLVGVRVLQPNPDAALAEADWIDQTAGGAVQTTPIY